MENIINNKIKLIIFFVLINFLLLDGCVVLMLLLSTVDNTNLMELKTLLGFPYFLIVNLNKLYLLPILIIFLTKNIKNVQLLNIIHKFRNSIFIQLIILLLVFLITPIILTIISALSLNVMNFSNITNNFLIFFKLNIKLGAYQAYIIMYLYWLIALMFQKITILKRFKTQNLTPLLDDIYGLVKDLSYSNFRNFIHKHKIICATIVILIILFLAL